jgi:hypothetical protein
MQTTVGLQPYNSYRAGWCCHDVCRFIAPALGINAIQRLAPALPKSSRIQRGHLPTVAHANAMIPGVLLAGGMPSGPTDSVPNRLQAGTFAGSIGWRGPDGHEFADDYRDLRARTRQLWPAAPHGAKLRSRAVKMLTARVQHQGDVEYHHSRVTAPASCICRHGCLIPKCFVTALNYGRPSGGVEASRDSPGIGRFSGEWAPSCLSTGAIVSSRAVNKRIPAPSIAQRAV